MIPLILSFIEGWDWLELTGHCPSKCDITRKVHLFQSLTYETWNLSKIFFYSWACFVTCFKSFMHVLELLVSSCLAAVWLLWSSLSSLWWDWLELTGHCEKPRLFFHSRAFKQKHKEKWKLTIGYSDPFDPLFHLGMRLVGAYRSLSS